MDQKKYILTENVTLFEALKKIDVNQKGAIFIADHEEKIIGIATDGDIRACLLRGISMHERLSEAVNKNFVWCHHSVTTEQILRLFDTNIKIIPLLDDEMRLVDVITPENWEIKSHGLLTTCCKVPSRISFGGGGSDVTEFFTSNNGAVLNVAISLYCNATLTLLENENIIIESYDLDTVNKYRNLDDFLSSNDELSLIRAAIEVINPKYGFCLSINSDFPVGSGLGGSSAVLAAILGCFNELRENKWNAHELAEMCFKIERVDLNISGGWQDQYACVFGGFNFIEFTPTKNSMFPLRIPNNIKLELEENLVLFPISSGRNSGLIHDDQKLKIQTAGIKKLLNKNVKLCYEMKDNLIRGQIDLIGEALDAVWSIKRELSEKISNPSFDKTYREAIKNGALGGKLLGAGGGGFFLFYVTRDKKFNFLRAMRNIGLKPIKFQFDVKGLQSWTASLQENL